MFKKTPFRPDTCGHGGYLFSFEEPLGLKYDIYYFENHSKKGKSFCFRYGFEGSQYISPGTIEDVIQYYNYPPYSYICQWLKENGTIEWRPK